MKFKWLLMAAVAVVCLWDVPFVGTDVAKLQPVEIVAVSSENGGIMIRTDTDAWGYGDTLPEAIEELKRCATGRILLETADYVLIEYIDHSVLDDLLKYLRPGCGLCLCDGDVDLKAAAQFLRSNVPSCTVLQCRIGEIVLQRLVSRGEGVCYAS